MAEKRKCARCKEEIEPIDNILGSSFWGLIQQKTETTERQTLRVACTTIRHKDQHAIRADDEMPLCDPCWGLLVGRFLQGRDVVSVEHPHEWRQMREPLLERCDLCYQTRISQGENREEQNR